MKSRFAGSRDLEAAALKAAVTAAALKATRQSAGFEARSFPPMRASNR